MQEDADKRQGVASTCASRAPQTVLSFPVCNIALSTVIRHSMLKISTTGGTVGLFKAHWVFQVAQGPVEALW